MTLIWNANLGIENPTEPIPNTELGCPSVLVMRACERNPESHCVVFRFSDEGAVLGFFSHSFLVICVLQRFFNGLIVCLHKLLVGFNSLLIYNILPHILNR